MSPRWIVGGTVGGGLTSTRKKQLYHHSPSFHASLLSPSVSNYVSLEHLPLTLGPSRSLLYPLVGNQPHASKQSITHTHTHTDVILQHHGPERSFHGPGLVFQMVISSHCCSSVNQKSHTAVRVIISPSEGKKPTSLAQGRCREMCVCVM